MPKKPKTKTDRARRMWTAIYHIFWRKQLPGQITLKEIRP